MTDPGLPPIPPPGPVEEVFGDAPTPPPRSSPRLPGWGAGLIVLAVFFAAQAGVGFVFAVYATMVAGPAGVQALLNAHMTWLVLASFLIGGAACWVAARLLAGGPLLDRGRDWIGLRRSTVKVTALATFAGGALALCIFALALLVPMPRKIDTPMMQMASQTGWLRVVFLVTVVLLAPLIEEFVFRGALFGGLARNLGKGGAAAIVTVLFALVHATEAVHWWPAFLLIGGMGALAVVFRGVTGSLAPAVCVHLAYNSIISVISFAGS